MKTLAAWWQATRPYSFTASATPVLVGSAVAARGGQFSPLLFAITLVASVAIHAGTNLINDYYDHVRGVDTPQSIGPGGAIQRGLLSPDAVRTGGFALLGLGSVLGLWLVALVGWPILIVGLLSVLAGYAYTGGPLPLGYVGLGDLVVFIFMGPVIVLGAYYVQTRGVSAGALWSSLPVGALVTAILVVNNLRDLTGDRARGKRTLATSIGSIGTRAEYALLVAGAYAAVIAGVLLGRLPLLALLDLRHHAARRRYLEAGAHRDRPEDPHAGGTAGDCPAPPTGRRAARRRVVAAVPRVGLNPTASPARSSRPDAPSSSGNTLLTRITL